jgi:hypothetical protein
MESLVPTPLTPIDVSGFYKVTAPTEVAYYVTTDLPTLPVSKGWTAVGIQGIIGQIQVTGVSFESGPGYKWVFTLQSDTDQNIQGIQQSIGAVYIPWSVCVHESKDQGSHLWIL